MFSRAKLFSTAVGVHLEAWSAHGADGAAARAYPGPGAAAAIGRVPGQSWAARVARAACAGRAAFALGLYGTMRHICERFEWNCVLDCCFAILKVFMHVPISKTF